MKTRFIKLNGTPFENGRVTGVLFKDKINSSIAKYSQLVKNEDAKQQCISAMRRLREFNAGYYDEVCGKAEGACVDLHAFFVMMCPEICGKMSLCTDVIIRKDGRTLLSHNEDDDYTQDSFCITQVTEDDGWFATNDIYNMPFGNGYSWNSYGIVKTINSCTDPEVDLNHIPRYFLQRHITAARSLDDLIARCKAFHPASGFHVNALDINTGAAVSVEVYPDDVSVKYVEEVYVHSNHYIHDRFRGRVFTSRRSNSVFRLEKASELVRELKEVNLKNVKKILMYRGPDDMFEDSILSTAKDPYITGANFSVDTAQKDKIFLDVLVNDEQFELPYSLE